MSLKNIALHKQVDLARYTTIKIGGRAQYFFVAESEDDLSAILGDCGRSISVLGRGSNLLISDAIITRPIVQLGKSFSSISRKGDFLEVGASASLAALLNFCLKEEIGGFAHLAGIPASLGGLLCMNASSFSEAISGTLHDVDIVDSEGTARTLVSSDIVFDYRRSSLESHIITRARFRIKADAGIRQKVNMFLKKRLSSQDFTQPSCGCIFKNPSFMSAGRLIEACGLKGLRHGGAEISQRHANFILNVNGATYDDVDYLIQHIKNLIFKKNNILLEEEIKRWA